MKKYTTSTDIYKEEIAKNTLKVSLKEDLKIIFETVKKAFIKQEGIGLIQIADLKKNNDYAMWLKAVEKVKCYVRRQRMR